MVLPGGRRVDGRRGSRGCYEGKGDCPGGWRTSNELMAKPEMMKGSNPGDTTEQREVNWIRLR